MGDVDYKLICELEKEEQDPPRHPLPVSGTDNTEKVIESAINFENAIDRIREEMQNDRQLQTLYKKILKEVWEKHRKDPAISQCYSLKEELYVADGLIFRLNPNHYIRETLPCCHKK